MKSINMRAGLLAVALLATALAAAAGPRYRFNQDNVPGWTLMSPAERTAHREKMLSIKTFDDCKAYSAEHQQLIDGRAKEKGVTLRGPRYNACDRMKARGMIR